MGDIARAEDYFQQASALSDTADQLSRQRNTMNKSVTCLQPSVNQGEKATAIVA